MPSVSKRRVSVAEQLSAFEGLDPVAPQPEHSVDTMRQIANDLNETGQRASPVE